MLDNYNDGNLRKEVQKILNKGEAINLVARLIFFGKQGRLNESKIERQLEKVSPLGNSHINFLGRYILDEPKISIKDGLRKLKIKAQE